jgi:hypothetical protein
MAKTLTVYLAADLKKFNSGMDQAGKKAQGLSGTMNKMLGPALIGAGVAAGAFATKLAVDGVKAAIDNEKAMASLATTMENLGVAHDFQAVEDYVYQLERAYGVADTDLRPAYERLLRATRDATQAQDLLKLSMDISAGTGKDLKTVTEALGKAFEGTTTGLSRLGGGIDKATLATGDMNEITQMLADTFDGQADAAAKTFGGQLQRLQTAVDNLGEAFGTGLIGNIEDTEDRTQGLVEAMEDLEPIIYLLGERASTTAESLGKVITPLADLATGAQAAEDETSWLSKSIDYMVNDFPLFWNGLKTVGAQFDRYSDSADDATEATVELRSATVLAGIAAGENTAYFQDLTPAMEDLGKRTAEAAKGYQNLYQGMADVAQLQRDLAGTSGTVAGALASGYLNPETVPLMNKYNERSDRKNARKEERRREREAEARRARLDNYDPPNTAVKDQDRDARAKARGVKTRTAGR